MILFMTPIFQIRVGVGCFKKTHHELMRVSLNFVLRGFFAHLKTNSTHGKLVVWGLVVWIPGIPL